MDRKLQQFLAVAEMGNVSLAASALNVTQPTVSANLKALEHQYGVPLFVRSSRGVVLTEFGSTLLDHVRSMDQLNKHAAKQIWEMKTNARPKLRIACGVAWLESIVLPALREFRSAHSEVNVHLDVCSSLEGLKHLVSGSVSLFLGTRIQKIAAEVDLPFEKLFETSDVFFARNAHPLAGKRTQLDDLRPYPRLDIAPYKADHLGLAEEDHDSLTAYWDGFAGSAQLASNSLAAGIGLLRDTDAWLYYPRQMKAAFDAQGIGVLKVADQPKIATDIGIYTRRDQAPSDEHERIANSLRQAVTAAQAELVL